MTCDLAAFGPKFGQSIFIYKCGVADLVMKELGKRFDAAHVEKTWGQWWEQQGFYRAGESLTAAGDFGTFLPPPNVTGTLHMGHGFNQTIIDVLTRYHRMLGHNTLWQPGTDHAGIATQMVVERELAKSGLSRHSLGREAFIQKVWQWKSYSGDAIVHQMRRLGGSCDWNRMRFTMDPKASELVSRTFVRLYQEGLIYRGKRLVNWDPVLGTAVSDLEVVNTEEQGSLYYIRYPLVSGTDSLVVATTRPETLFGDMALMVHPDDERYQHCIGQLVYIPVSAQERTAWRKIPVIADDYVDPEFGTGCVKVTPAHDFNDYEVGQRHQLDLLSILDTKACLNEQVPPAYHGLSCQQARQKLQVDLEHCGLLQAQKVHTLMVPRGDRSQAIIEPLLTDQWFLAVTQATSRGESMAQRAKRAVEDQEIGFFPEGWSKTYTQWLDNIQDWCISRQLWWGHQIPAWYGDSGELFVAETLQEAQAQAQAQGYQGALTRDPDVLDTWYSSGLWPLLSLDWEGAQTPTRESIDFSFLSHYLPSSVLVTGFDIIFFWVARMVMLTLHFTDQVPFKAVYVHGLIRDFDGQKMSKSKGNTLDPLDIIDGITLDQLIEKRVAGIGHDPAQCERVRLQTQREFPEGVAACGADALRFTFAALASPGRDIRFDLQRCVGYAHFCNKLWNAARFVAFNLKPYDALQLTTALPGGGADPISAWIESRLQQVTAAAHTAYATFRLDLLAQQLYDFVWHDLCNWYLELFKLQMKCLEAPQQAWAAQVLWRVFDRTLRLLHPLMPFVTEELWQHVIRPYLPQSEGKMALVVQAYPRTEDFSSSAQAWVEQLKAVLVAVRNLRGEMKLSPGQRVPLWVVQPSGAFAVYEHYIKGLGQVSEVSFVSTLPEQEALIASVGDARLMLSGGVSAQQQQQRLEKEQKRLNTEIERLEQQLSNAQFRERAPKKIVEKTEKLLQDCQRQRDALQQS